MNVFIVIVFLVVVFLVVVFLVNVFIVIVFIVILKLCYQCLVQIKYSLIAVNRVHASLRFMSSCNAILSRAVWPSKYFDIEIQAFLTFSSSKRLAIADK